MISISAFVISLFGIISLLYFRSWEIRRGERFFSDEREKLDEKVISFGEYINKFSVIFDRSIILRIYHTTAHYFALIVLGTIKIIERRMVYLLEHIRGKREIKRGVTQSEFLKRVADHKQSLEKPPVNKVE